MKIQGLITAPVTPFKSDGSINPDCIPEYATFLKNQGVAGAFVNGTTGEGFSLTDDERKIMTEAWCSEKTADFKVIIHVGHTSQQTSKELAQNAENFGADAIGELGPIFFKPSTVKELVSYCQNTAKATSLPYYFYHMPSMNGLDFPMINFLQEANGKIPTLAGIKYTHHDLEDFAQCVNFADGKYDLLFGRDEKLLDSLALNAVGAVGSTYNCFAPLYIDIIKAFNSGNIDEAKQLQQTSIDIIKHLASKQFFSALRHAMRIQGLETGEPRLPLGRLNAKEKIELEENLKKVYSHSVELA